MTNLFVMSKLIFYPLKRKQLTCKPDSVKLTLDSISYHLSKRSTPSGFCICKFRAGHPVRFINEENRNIFDLATHQADSISGHPENW